MHLQIDKSLPVLRELTQNGVKVFLMHLDDEAKTQMRLAERISRLHGTADPEGFRLNADMAVTAILHKAPPQSHRFYVPFVELQIYT